MLWRKEVDLLRPRDSLGTCDHFRPRVSSLLPDSLCNSLRHYILIAESDTLFHSRFLSPTLQSDIPPRTLSTEDLPCLILFDRVQMLSSHPYPGQVPSCNSRPMVRMPISHHSHNSFSAKRRLSCSSARRHPLSYTSRQALPDCWDNPDLQLWYDMQPLYHSLVLHHVPNSNNWPHCSLPPNASFQLPENTSKKPFHSSDRRQCQKHTDYQCCSEHGQIRSLLISHTILLLAYSLC